MSAERLLAVFVGSEWKRKGLEAAIRALAMGSEWDLAVAGAGDVAHYRALAQECGVAHRVHWLGVLRDVQLAYEMADAFVLPSSYETFSLVTFEAAANALPILATPVNGVRELIRDGENGYLITQRPELIAQRLRELAADPGLRARLGGAARESALHYSWGEMVSKHAALYRSLRASARRDPPVAR